MTFGKNKTEWRGADSFSKLKKYDKRFLKVLLFDKIREGKRFKMYYVVLRKRKLLSGLLALVLTAAALTALFATDAHAVFYGSNLKKLPIYSVETEEKKLSISFDCAWGVDYTDKLLSAMAKEGVRCTFFTVEFWAEKHPEYLKKISDAGHEIGTHSATHPKMSKLSASAIDKELETSVNAIEKVIGKKVELFRPPFGDYNDLLIERAKEAGLYTVQWSVDSLDWKDLSAKEIENRVLSRAKNGSIVLFHNQGLHTAEAIPNVIKTLKARGYEFVPIGELIYREKFSMRPDGAQVKNENA